MGCKFMKAWIGPCGKEGYCEHWDWKCDDHPEEKATHECDSAGQFVCGRRCCAEHFSCMNHMSKKSIVDYYERKLKHEC